MAELRIGVDARPLCHPGTGIYRYTFELLQRMCRRGGQWYFYSAQPYDTGAFDFPNVTHRIAGLPRRLRAAQLAHAFFPRWIRADKLDAFWGTRHQLPFAMPREVRSVVTIYDLVWLRYGDTMRFPGRQIESFFMPRAIAAADAIAAISRFTAKEVETVFPQHASKVALVPCASMLAPQTSPGAMIDEQEAGFLVVGTLEPRKNLQRLLQAYALYASRREHPRPLRIIGGQGWGDVNLEQSVAELGIGHLVQILGRVDDETLGYNYRRAHALVMPSLYEGFGLPVVESLSSGVPVIVSRDSSMSEVAGEAGLQVDPRSVTDIARALDTLSDRNETYQRLQARALPESRRYDWDRSAQALWGLLSG